MGSDNAEQKQEQDNTVPLQNASLQQLNMVKQQLEKEIGGLGRNMEALREAEVRFQASTDCLGYLNPDNNGKSMMVPLTSSLYVDGKMSNTSTVVVDVGTGYFIEMSVARAKDFCGRRSKMLADNCAKVEKVLKEKRKNLETVTMIMQQKLYKMQQEEGQKS
eukprot:TRINITY_DN53981_c0_g1_i1.p2 TRINITY_DN53981_c0_g1~~TRINITY_DN53981_c0_g1_i1.p2  ORF type:complete len:162 (-),score=66.37 TRINITY_DN53981_c0_g1_i1:157-642(-)